MLVRLTIKYKVPHTVPLQIIQTIPFKVNGKPNLHPRHFVNAALAAIIAFYNLWRGLFQICSSGHCSSSTFWSVKTAQPVRLQSSCYTFWIKPLHFQTLVLFCCREASPQHDAATTRLHAKFTSYGMLMWGLFGLVYGLSPDSRLTRLRSFWWGLALRRFIFSVSKMFLHPSSWVVISNKPVTDFWGGLFCLHNAVIARKEKKDPSNLPITDTPKITCHIVTPHWSHSDLMLHIKTVNCFSCNFGVTL